MTRDPAEITVYGVALGVHVVTAALGFGMLGLSGVYAGRCRHVHTAEDWHDVQRFFGPPNRVGHALWAVPFAGGIALWLHDGAVALGEMWVIIATAVWVATTLLAFWVIWPAERRLGPIVTASGTAGASPQAGPSPEAGAPDPGAPPRPELVLLCRRIQRTAALCDIFIVVALGLMIFQPGR